MAVVEANNHFPLSLEGKPSFNRGDAYIHNMLVKGECIPAELRPSTPVAEKFIDLMNVERRCLKPICNGVESQFFQMRTAVSSPLPGKKMSSDQLILVDSDDKDLSHHLLFACAHGKLDAVQLVLTLCNNIDLNAPLPCANDQGLTPLGVAALSTNNSSLCECLIRAGAKVNQVDSQGLCALHWAVLATHLNVVKTLLANGAGQEQVDKEGLTPLHYACISGLPSIVSALIKESPSLASYQESATGVTPLILACLRGNGDVVKILLRHIVSNVLLQTDRMGMSPIHYAVWGQSVNCVKILASYSTWRKGVTQGDIWGRTPLIIAAAKGDLIMCRLLLKKGAKLGEVDGEGMNVLHWSVLSGQVSCVEFVLQCKNGLNLCSQQDSGGATPLHYAATRRDESILAIILKKAPDILTITTFEGYTPLIWASSCGRLNCVQALLEARRDEDEGERDSDGYQPLHAATTVGTIEIVKTMLVSGFKVDSMCPEGLIPLHYACHYGHVACVEEFLSCGVHVDTLTTKQESGLHLAVIHGHNDAVGKLLEYGASRDRPVGERQNRPIHLACLHGHSEVLQTIISSAGACVDQPRASDGHTPLYLAASQGHLDCCKVLVEHGADTGIRMKSSIEGLTALDVAMKNCHAGCVNYLIFCHAPSGGGTYHRATSIIQAVWRYHRYKRRRAIAFRWSAIVIQRCIRRWLGRIRSRKVRQTRTAAYHRAARLIQLKWRQYIAEKRRYKATYSRLQARLKQEQLAATLILAELQSQEQSVRLPSSTTTAPRTKPFAMSAPQKTVPSPMYLLRTLTSFHSDFPIKGAPVVSAQPRTPLQSPIPTIKLQNSLTGKLTTSLPPLPPIQEASRDSSSGREVHLPPLPSNHALVAVPSEISSKLNSVADNSNSNTHHDDRRTNTVSNISVEKLPAIAKLSNESILKGSINPLDTAALKIKTDTSQHSKLTPNPLVLSSLSGSNEGISPLKLPSRTRHKITRYSTFKDTPLGYKPYFSQENRRNKEESPPLMEDLENIGLDYSGEESGEKTQKVIFADVSSLVDVSNGSVSSEVVDEDLTDGGKEEEKLSDADDQPCESLLNNQESQKVLLNQVERFGRLMEVLNILKEAKAMDDMESVDEGGVVVGGTAGVRTGGIEELKDHIKLALDEAVKLRMETTSMLMQNRNGLQTQSVSTSLQQS